MDLLLNVTYQSLMTLLVAAGRLADHAPEFIPRITAYVEDARRRDIRITECITDAKGDRSLAPAKQSDPDAYVRVVGRRPDGVVIRGAKLHITAAAYGHDLLVMPTKSMKPGEEDYAIACAVPVGSPGVHVTNTTYHPRAGDPRDYPVSARASVPDSVVIFDDVFVPTERVFLDGQAAHAAVFAHSLGLWERLGGVSFMVTQADELVGLASLIAEANGLSRVPHVREKIDEMMIHATLLRAGLEAALVHAHATPEGYYYPDDMYTNVAKYHGAANFSTMVRHLHDIAGGAVVTAPSMSDFDNPELRPLLEKYMGTGAGHQRRVPVQAVPRHPRHHRGRARRLAPGDEPAVRRRPVRAEAGHPQELRHRAGPRAGPEGRRAIRSVTGTGPDLTAAAFWPVSSRRRALRYPRPSEDGQSPRRISGGWVREQA